jgi:hypothetical protein
VDLPWAGDWGMLVSEVEDCFRMWPHLVKVLNVQEAFIADRISQELGDSAVQTVMFSQKINLAYA